MSKFETFKGEDDQYYWRLKGGNGEILAQSEGYTRSESALRAIYDVQMAVVEASKLIPAIASGNIEYIDNA